MQIFIFNFDLTTPPDASQPSIHTPASLCSLARKCHIGSGILSCRSRSYGPSFGNTVRLLCRSGRDQIHRFCAGTCLFFCQLASPNSSSTVRVNVARRSRTARSPSGSMGASPRSCSSTQRGSIASCPTFVPYTDGWLRCMDAGDLVWTSEMLDQRTQELMEIQSGDRTCMAVPQSRINKTMRPRALLPCPGVAAAIETQTSRAGKRGAGRIHHIFS